MNTSDNFREDIITGKTCHYCGNPTELVSSKEIYRTGDYGMIYLCRQCRAYVGCHKGTHVALGSVANNYLRKARNEAHKYFDQIWKLKVFNMSRREAYRWLSEKLNVPEDKCHIAMFNLDLCRDTVFFSKQLLNDNRRVDLDFGADPVTPFYEYD